MILTSERLAEIRALPRAPTAAPHAVMCWAISDLLAHLDSLKGEWRPVAEFDFPTKHAEDSRPVLVWDGHHRAVAHCTYYDSERLTWWIDNSYGYNEDGEIYGVIAFQELPAPPSSPAGDKA